MARRLRGPVEMGATGATYSTAGVEIYSTDGALRYSTAGGADRYSTAGAMVVAGAESIV